MKRATNHLLEQRSRSQQRAQLTACALGSSVGAELGARQRRNASAVLARACRPKRTFGSHAKRSTSYAARRASSRFASSGAATFAPLPRGAHFCALREGTHDTT